MYMYMLLTGNASLGFEKSILVSNRETGFLLSAFVLESYTA